MKKNYIDLIKNHPVMDEVLKDSYGGVIYNVANKGKYDSDEILSLWDKLDNSEKESAGEIIKGAIHFLQGRQ